MRSIVYLSQDGVLDPVGWSQVGRVVIALACAGFRYTVISLEKREALSDSARVTRAREAFGRAGVTWVPLPFRDVGRGAAVENFTSMLSAAASHVRRGADLVHARSYPPTVSALALRDALGIPYVFDARGYWLDERIEAGSIPSRAGRVARLLEERLYRRAATVVTLTELQAADVRTRFRKTPATCIPTCADFEAFALRESAVRARPAMLGDGVWIGLVGSVNPSYRPHDALRIVARMLAARSDARLAVLTPQVALMQALVAEAGIDPSRTVVTSVAPDDMPQWVPHLDWAVQILNTTPAKRASMPTKLAEFLACGVRVVHHGCNEEVGSWIRRTEAGLVLDDLSESTISEAVAAFRDSRRDLDAATRTRTLAAQHFSLESGVHRYVDVLGSLDTR